MVRWTEIENHPEFWKLNKHSQSILRRLASGVEHSKEFKDAWRQVYREPDIRRKIRRGIWYVLEGRVVSQNEEKLNLKEILMWAKTEPYEKRVAVLAHFFASLGEMKGEQICVNFGAAPPKRLRPEELVEKYGLPRSTAIKLARRRNPEKIVKRIEELAEKYGLPRSVATKLAMFKDPEAVMEKAKKLAKKYGLRRSVAVHFVMSIKDQKRVLREMQKIAKERGVSLSTAFRLYCYRRRRKK